MNADVNAQPPESPDIVTVVLLNLNVIDRLRIVILPPISAQAYYFGVVSNSLYILPGVERRYRLRSSHFAISSAFCNDL